MSEFVSELKTLLIENDNINQKAACFVLKRLKNSLAISVESILESEGNADSDE